MAVTIDQLSQDLNANGLLSAEEISEVHAGLAPGKQSNPQDLAKALIRQKKLTKFQATLAYQGKSQNLAFGEYVILDKIGEGGMGQVYRAQHRRMKREVAIKVLPAAAMKEQDAVDRFYREVEAAAKLEHPNIVTAHDASEHNGMHYLVMQYIRGKDLSVIVKE